MASDIKIQCIFYILNSIPEKLPFFFFFFFNMGGQLLKTTFLLSSSICGMRALFGSKANFSQESLSC